MSDEYDWAEDPTAQDVIDALRLLMMAQKDPAEVQRVVACLLDFAPETDSGRGISLVMRLLSEGQSFSVSNQRRQVDEPVPSKLAVFATKSVRV